MFLFLKFDNAGATLAKCPIEGDYGAGYIGATIELMLQAGKKIEDLNERRE